MQPPNATEDAVAISVMAEDLGVQPEALKGELIGITYDSKDGCLEIITPSMTHQIANPTQAFVPKSKGSRKHQVLAPDGTKQIMSSRRSTDQGAIAMPVRTCGRPWETQRDD